jgi:hypothetical protein
LTAGNGLLPDPTQAFTLTINQAPAIVSANATTLTVGRAGSFTVATTGFPLSALLASGAMPGGGTVVNNHNGTATLRGTPAPGTAGTYPLTLTANNGVSPGARQDFTLTVNQAPAFTSANAATFVEGFAGTFTVTTSGPPTVTTIGASGSLPGVVGFVDNHDGTATLSGTPAAGTAGTYSLTLTAGNGVLPDATQFFTLTVASPAPPAFTSGNAVLLVVGSAGSFTVTTTGIPTAALSETGALPGGVTFVDNHDGTATLAGTPAPGTAATYPLTLTAGNGVPPNATQAFTLTVDQPPAVTIDQAAGQADPTGAATVTFTVVFSKPVTGFTTGDVTLGGTALPASAVVTGSGTTYTVTVSGMIRSGTVSVTVAAGVAVDSAGGGNLASTSTDNRVAYTGVVATIGVYESATGKWYLRNHNSAGAPDLAPFAFGAPYWLPVLGDWNRDGKTSVGVVDPVTEKWYLRNTNTAGPPDVPPFAFGRPGWVPVAGDWDGDGATNVGAVDLATETWYLAAPSGVLSFRFGAPGWQPVVGDWDGDGTTTVGVLDPAGKWYLRNSNSGGAPDVPAFAFGAGSWQPVAGDWDSNGTTTVGVLDPAGTWYLRNRNSAGAPDVTPFAYGVGSWKPLAGDWNFPAAPLPPPRTAATPSVAPPVVTLPHGGAQVLPRLGTEAMDPATLAQLAQLLAEDSLAAPGTAVAGALYLRRQNELDAVFATWDRSGIYVSW